MYSNFEFGKREKDPICSIKSTDNPNILSKNRLDCLLGLHSPTVSN